MVDFTKETFVYYAWPSESENNSPSTVFDAQKKVQKMWRKIKCAINSSLLIRAWVIVKMMFKIGTINFLAFYDLNEGKYATFFGPDIIYFFTTDFFSKVNLEQIVPYLFKIDFWKRLFSHHKKRLHFKIRRTN